MRLKFNTKSKVYIILNIISMLFCFYLIWSYTTFDGLGIYCGCLMFPIGILFLSRAPVDGFVGRWVLPTYGMVLNFLLWGALDAASKRLGQAAGEGLDVGVILVLCQFVGNILPFLPTKVQRIMKFRLGYGMILFYPIGIILMSIFVK